MRLIAFLRFDFFGQRRLSQQGVNAVADVIAVGARIFFERTSIFGQPDVSQQLVFQNLKVDLTVSRQLVVGDLLWAVARICFR
jgi:hypothetical protein